jgi:hypothetical protein
MKRPIKSIPIPYPQRFKSPEDASAWLDGDTTKTIPPFMQSPDGLGARPNPEYAAAPYEYTGYFLRRAHVDLC